MSYRKEKHLSLSGLTHVNYTTNDLKKIAQNVLETKMYGLCDFIAKFKIDQVVFSMGTLFSFITLPFAIFFDQSF